MNCGRLPGGDLDIGGDRDHALRYQNPITATLTVPIDDFGNTSLSLSSQGFLTASAAFIPDITSDLTWKSKYPLYSVKDAIQVANYI